MEVKGIKDLMLKDRFQAKHIAKTMIDNGAPGNWSAVQNIYNLMSGDIVPKDPYVFIVLSRMLNVELHDILMRYSSRTIESLSTDHDEQKPTEKFIWPIL